MLTKNHKNQYKSIFKNNNCFDCRNKKKIRFVHLLYICEGKYSLLLYSFLVLLENVLQSLESFQYIYFYFLKFINITSHFFNIGNIFFASI